MTHSDLEAGVHVGQGVRGSGQCEGDGESQNSQAVALHRAE